jgi:hypothetical protein
VEWFRVMTPSVLSDHRPWSLADLRPLPAAASVRPRSTWLLLLAAVMTVVDGAATYVWLASGHALEANPWLAALADRAGPGPAMATRVAVGLALLAALGVLLPRARLARAGLGLVTVALAAVTLWHGYGAAMLVGMR